MIDKKDLPALKERFRTILREELGLAKFAEDKDGDFSCHYENMPFFVVFHDDDPAFVWIKTYAYWFKDCARTPVETVEAVMNVINYRCKAAKIARFLEPDREGDYAVAVSVSFLVDDPASLTAATIERYLWQLKVASRDFHRLLEEHEGAGNERLLDGAPAPAVRH